MQKITDDPLQQCPECRCKVKRLISLNNFHLKGSGWYATDYGSKNNGKSSGTTQSQGPNENEKKKSAESSSSSSDADKSAKSASSGSVS